MSLRDELAAITEARVREEEAIAAGQVERILPAVVEHLRRMARAGSASTYIVLDEYSVPRPWGRALEGLAHILRAEGLTAEIAGTVENPTLRVSWEVTRG